MAENKVEFGADGIRGVYGRWPMEAPVLAAVGRAIAYFARSRLAAAEPSVVVGRDTRLHGADIEQSIVVGLLEQGVHVTRLGVMPTPGVAYLARSQRAEMGVVVSASHSPPEYNGIKLIGPQGLRLREDEEKLLEKLIAVFHSTPPHPPAEAGQCADGRHLVDLYVNDHTQQDWPGFGLPAERPLARLSAVLDCANGAAGAVAPRVFTALGAEAHPLHASLAEGAHINHSCGSEHARDHPEALAAELQRLDAHYAFAFDGDGDRLAVVDALGRVYDGCDLLYVLASAFAAAGRLEPRVVVTNELTNRGLGASLAAQGIAMRYVSKGDKNVEQALWENGYLLGGEEGGNIIVNDGRHTAADATYAALLVAATVLGQGRSLAELTAGLVKYPRRLQGFRLPFDATVAARLRDDLARCEARLGPGGRLEVWAATTEPGVTRLLAEGGPHTAPRLVDVVFEEAAAALRRAVG